MAQKNDPEDLVVRSEVWMDDLPNSDLVPFMFARFQKWPSNTAIMCERTGRSYTYEALEDGSLKWGAALLHLAGGSAPSCVAIFAPSIPEYPMAVLGAMAIGSTVTCLPVTLTPNELCERILDSGATAMLIDASMEDKYQEILEVLAKEQHPPVIAYIGPNAQGCADFMDIINDDAAERVQPVKNSGSKTALIPHSSGTTGRSKAVCLSHAALTNSIMVRTHPTIYVKDKQTTSIGLMPLCRTHVLFGMAFISFYHGGKFVCLGDENPLAYAEAIQKHKVWKLHMYPSLLRGLASSPLVKKEHLSSVRVVLVGGADVHPTTSKAFKQKFGNEVIIQEGLGSTETQSVIVTPLNEEWLGYCGKLMPNAEAKVVDLQTGKSLGPDLTGELLVKCSTMLSRYHTSHEAAANAFDPDGWFHTGDIAQYTEDGFFSIAGRLSDLIQTDEGKVLPADIEEVILQVEAVAEAGVVGVPNVTHGELPKAFVVLKNSSLTDQGIMDQIKSEIEQKVAEKLSSHMRLSAGIVFVSELPKNAAGKLLRKTLHQKATMDI